MARSSECMEQYAQKVLDRSVHCQRRDFSSTSVFSLVQSLERAPRQQSEGNYPNGPLPPRNLVRTLRLDLISPPDGASLSLPSGSGHEASQRKPNRRSRGPIGLHGANYALHDLFLNKRGIIMDRVTERARAGRRRRSPLHYPSCSWPSLRASTAMDPVGPDRWATACPSRPHGGDGSPQQHDRFRGIRVRYRRSAHV